MDAFGCLVDSTRPQGGSQLYICPSIIMLSLPSKCAVALDPSQLVSRVGVVGLVLSLVELDC
jgi:hypothetical protein